MFNRLHVTIPAAFCVSSIVAIAGCGDPDASSSASVEDATVATASAEEAVETEQDAQQQTRDAVRSARDAARELTTTAPTGERTSASGQIHVVAEPAVLDLGEMATGETRSGVVTLRNTGDEPILVRNSRTSCGCTVANVPTGQELAPGDEVDVDVSLRGGTRPERLSKTVTFMFDGQPDVTVRVEGQTIAYVAIEPAIINPDQLPDDLVTVRSEDGEPFRVTAIHPRIYESLPEEASSEHKIKLSWDRWEESGQPRRLLVHIDHPKATQLSAAIRVPATRTASADTRSRAPLSPEVLVTQNRTEEFLERLSDEENEVDLEATDRSGATLLGIAAKSGNIEIMQALIDAGADLEATDRNGGTPLMHAARSKNADAVRLLIGAGANIDTRDTSLANTALSWAAGFGDADSVRELLDAGAQVEIVSTATGFTPLILAAGFGEPESIQLLIEAGAEVEAVDNLQTFTPLMYAASTGKTENMRTLLEGGANVEATDPTGRSVLLIAAGAANANAEAISMLLEAGADPSVVDSDGMNALQHAERRSDARRDEVMSVLEPVVVAQN